MRMLDRTSAVLNGQTSQAADEEYLDWAYGHAAFRIPDEVDARFDLLDALRDLRRANLVLGRSTEAFSRADHWFLRECIDNHDPQRAQARLALLDEPLFSSGDAEFPRLLREAAELARMNEDHDGSTPWIRRAFAELERLEENSPDPTRARVLLVARLDLCATNFLCELEGGAPELAEPWLDEYHRALQQSAAQNDPGRGFWILDGAYLRTRLADSLANHSQALRVSREALTDPAVQLLGSQEAIPAEYVRILARQAMARARLAQLTDDDAGLAEVLVELEEVLEAPDLRLQSETWVRLERARVWLDLDQAERGRAELVKLEAILGDRPHLREVAQALAVQWGRVGLAGALDPAALTAAELRLTEAWNALVGDRARAQPRKQGLGLLWFPAQRDLLETLLRVQSANHPHDRAASLGLDAWMQLQVQGSLIRDLRATQSSPSDGRSPGPPIKTLPDGTCALVYFPGREALHVFALLGSEVSRWEVSVKESHRNKTLRELQHAVLDVRARPTPQTEHALQDARIRVADLLIPPGLGEVLGTSTSLVVCGLQDLPDIPFEYLPAIDGEPLGCTHAVQRASSLPLWLELQRMTAEAPEDESDLVVSLVHLGSGSDREASRLTARDQARLLTHMDPNRVHFLAEDQAEAAALKRTLDTSVSAQALFVMAHGQAQGTGTELVLAGGERLGSTQLEALRLPPFVSFDTCGAGQRSKRPGDDGRGGLLGSCYVGGARTVVLPYWDVEVRAALLLREEVQRGLLGEGLPVAEAWRRARQALRHDEHDLHEVEYFLHPVFGDGFATLATHDSRLSAYLRKWPLVLGLSAAMLSGLYLLRRRSQRAAHAG